MGLSNFASSARQATDEGAHFEGAGPIDTLPKDRKEDEASVQARRNDDFGSSLLQALDALSAKGLSDEASFGAAAFLATVGISPPKPWTWEQLDLDLGSFGHPLSTIRTFHGMLEARDAAQRVLSDAEMSIQDISDPAEVMEALDRMDSLLSFLQQICILEDCFVEPPPSLKLPDRGSEYNWQEHFVRLRRVPHTLESSEAWRRLDASADVHDPTSGALLCYNEYFEDASRSN